MRCALRAEVLEAERATFLTTFDVQLGLPELTSTNDMIGGLASPKRVGVMRFV